ncbi:transposase [Streptomyces sp. NBC_00887]|uniref:transposase n=1 Tax=Streptomyces sp. NBC_00887 TaxID=2975859 RepID=UPI00386BB19B
MVAADPGSGQVGDASRGTVVAGYGAGRAWRSADAEWERLRPFLPVSNGRCGRWRDHRQVIDAIAWKFRTGAQWVHLPAEYGSWKGVYTRLRNWAIDGTWERAYHRAPHPGRCGRRPGLGRSG